MFTRVIKMLGPTHIAFEFKIKKDCLTKLRADGSFPEPDYLRSVGDGIVHVPYWKYETIAEFLTTYGIMS